MDTLSTALSRVQKNARLAQTRIEAKQAETSRQLFLPGMDEFMRALPNSIIWSSLFAPIAKDDPRTFHRETLLVTRGEVVMTYTGEQLDEGDADICMQLIFEAKSYPLGQYVTLNRAKLLRSIGRCTGNKDYQWLHRRLKAMTVATLFIETKKYEIGKTKAFHILAHFEYNDETKRYTFALDPRWVTLFGNREFALLDWEKRLQIKRGQNMAKALQRLVTASSDTVQRYALDWLKEKFQYTSPMRKFRTSLKHAMLELERLEIMAGSRIEHSTRGKEQAVWTRL